MGKSSGSIWVSLGLRTANFSKGISKAKKDLNGFQKFGQGLKGMFNPMTVGIGIVAGLGAVLSDAVGIFKDFEKANSALKAVLNGTDAEMKSLSDQAKLLGSTSAFTANEVSSLQKELAKLGFNSKQIENMTDATLNLAAAAGEELAVAAAFAGSTLNAFGLNSQDAAHITDVMALSFSSSALDMEKLSETMKNAAPIAKVTGVSFEVAAAAAAKLADANISGSKAGTDLRKIFSILVKDGKPFQESLNDIASELDGASTKAEKLGIAERLVGERAKGALLVLVDQKDALGLLATEFENADGTAKRMADTMLDNVAGSMTKAGSAYEGFILSIEDGNGVISNSMKSLIDGFTSVLSSLTDLNSGGIRAESALKRLSNVFLSISILSPFESIKHDIPIDQINAFEKAIKSTGSSLLTNEAGLNKVIAKYKSFGLSNLEAVKATKKLKEGLAIVDEIMPDVADGAEDAADEIIKLTAAQEKAAIAARNFGSVLHDSLSIKALPTGLTSAVQDIFEEIKKEGDKPRTLHIRVQPELIVDNPEESGAVINGDMIKLGESAGDALSGALVSAAQEGLVGLGEVLGKGGGAEEFGAVLLGGFSGLLKGFGEQMITLGLGMIALKAALALGPLGAGLAIAGGVALIAVASAIKGSMETSSAEGFAAGGLVTGSVFANIGEGRGTTKSNPEVIAPLDKLKSFMPNNDGMGGQVEFIIKGTNLVGVLKRTGKKASFSN